MVNGGWRLASRAGLFAGEPAPTRRPVSNPRWVSTTVLAEHLHARPPQQRRGYPFPRHFHTPEGAIIGQPVATRRAARLQHRYANAMPPYQLQRQPRTRQKRGTDIFTRHRQHLRVAIEHCAALPSRDLRWRPRCRQAAGYLRAQRHHAPFGLPLLQQIRMTACPAVIAYWLPQQAGAHQHLGPLRTGHCHAA